MLVWLLMFVCGNPFVGFYLDKFVNIILLLIVFIYYRPTFNMVEKKTISRWVIFLLLIFSGQLLVLGSVSYLACANFVAKLVLGFSIALIIGPRFKDAYISVMSVLALISLFFFMLQLLGITLPSIIPSEQKSSLGIYTISIPSEYSNYRLRNSGMFWEPGAYAGYINLAFMLYVNNLGELFKKYRAKVVILLIALLTTLSTTGYICLGIIFVFYVMESHVGKSAKVILLFITILFAVVLFNSLDFLGEKVVSQMETTSELSYDSNEHSRFGSILVDWFYIQLHPIFGNGFSLSTRYAYHLQFYDEDTLLGFGNGFTGIIGTLGIPFMLLYLYSFYKNRTLVKWGFMTGFVILALQGEQYMNYPLFIMLPFINYAGFRTI